MLNNLLGLEEEVDLRHLKEPCIIISHDLTPSNTAQLDKRNVLGFATDVGSKTSHTAIMARSLRIPAVVGLKDVSEQVADRRNTRCWTASTASSSSTPPTRRCSNTAS